MNETYRIYGVEDVYDAFDDYESSWPMEIIEVRAGSIDDAVMAGYEELNRIIDEKRVGFTSGHYYGRVERVEDSKGKTVYENIVTWIW